MNPLPISFAASALSDLREIQEWYLSQAAPQAGDRLLHEILQSVEQLAEYPESGRVVPEFEAEWLRELIRPPFRIVYRLEAERVRVVRVWRSERNMEDVHE